MYKQDEILARIKSLIQEGIPDARIYLFGSRITGKIHEESDWDVLIITTKKVDRKMKDSLQHKLFPISGEIYSFIDFTIVNEKDWLESPSYYVLRQSIKDEVVAL